MGWIRTFVERSLKIITTPKTSDVKPKEMLVKELENNTEIIKAKTKLQVYDQIRKRCTVESNRAKAELESDKTTGKRYSFIKGVIQNNTIITMYCLSKMDKIKEDYEKIGIEL